MILVRFTPAGYPMQRLSTEDIALDYQWFGYIKSISSIKFQLKNRYGGYAEPSFSDITLSPEVFSGCWPPPSSASVNITETDTDEVSGTVLFDGSASVTTFDRSGVNIVLKKPSFDIKVTSGANYNDTLINVATALCAPALLNLAIDTTKARASSPAVLRTTSADMLAIDLLSEMCAFFSHAFQIVGNTLYLVDMLGTQTPKSLTEFDVQKCEYRRADPILLVKSGTNSVNGSSPNGATIDISTEYHTTGANVLAALGDIKTMLEKDIPTIRFKADKIKPRILEQITLRDESTILPVTVSGTITSIIYNYDTLAVEAEVVGSVTA